MESNDNISAGDSNENLIGISASAILEFIDSHHLKTNHSHFSTHEVCANVIKPITSIHECSYVEYLQKSVEYNNSKYIGKANVFVSHAWQYSFLELFFTIAEWKRNNNRT